MSIDDMFADTMICNVLIVWVSGSITFPAHWSRTSFLNERVRWKHDDGGRMVIVFYECLRVVNVAVSARGASLAFASKACIRSILALDHILAADVPSRSSSCVRFSTHHITLIRLLYHHTCSCQFVLSVVGYLNTKSCSYCRACAEGRG